MAVAIALAVAWLALAIPAQRWPGRHKNWKCDWEDEAKSFMSWKNYQQKEGK